MEKDFNCCMYQIMSKEDMTKNKGYHHPTYKSIMLITKDGVTIELTEEEILEVVRIAGGNFKW
jgi:hypothetical protein